jgi:hypothetical protein
MPSEDTSREARADTALTVRRNGSPPFVIERRGQSIVRRAIAGTVAAFVLNVITGSKNRGLKMEGRRYGIHA